MNPLRISAISYLNTCPFVYGIKHSGLLENYSLSFDVPATCAQKLVSGQADIGIVPVAAIKDIPGSRVITEYCIGSEGPVKTVLMVSLSPLEKIKTVFLDPDSRTSVRLVKILARHFWKLPFQYRPLEPGILQNLPPGSAAVLIGDKTFGMEHVFPCTIDLSESWMKFSNLPFVFACWVSRGKLPIELENRFNKALAFGIDNLPQVMKSIDPLIYPEINLGDYFLNNLSYRLSDEKRKGMAYFLQLSEDLE